MASVFQASGSCSVQANADSSTTLSPCASGTFGRAATIDGNYAMVADPANSAVHVYVNSGSWQHSQTLSGTAGSRFGWSVALEGNVAVIGVPDSGAGSGAVKVYQESAGQWQLSATIEAPDADCSDFGYAISLSGTRVAVGDPLASSQQGGVWLFDNGGSEWPLSATIKHKGSLKHFGGAVALDGNTLFVGPGLYVNNADPRAGDDEPGYAYAFRQLGVPWLTSKLLKGQSGDRLFGASIALAGDTVVIGSPNSTSAGKAGAGCVFVFDRGGDKWPRNARLCATRSAEADRLFGAAVAIEGDMIVVGAPGKTRSGQGTGAAYRYSRSAGVWSFAGANAPDASTTGWGGSVALSGAQLLGAGGAPLQLTPTIAQIDAPAVLLVGEPCQTANDCATGQCVDGVCCQSACALGCEACSVAAGGLLDGVCTPSVADTVCRAAAGVCDVAEVCDGTSVGCPNDIFQPSGMVCRESTGGDDPAETCSGSSASCPDDAQQTSSMSPLPERSLLVSQAEAVPWLGLFLGGSLAQPTEGLDPIPLSGASYTP